MDLKAKLVDDIHFRHNASREINFSELNQQGFYDLAIEFKNRWSIFSKRNVSEITAIIESYKNAEVYISEWKNG